MEKREFIEKYPRLYHTTSDGAWPSIRANGILSTRSLVRAFQPAPEIAEAILRDVRKTSYTLTSPERIDVTIRDQRPLKFLDVCLEPGVTRQDYLDALNSRVFFHVNDHDLLKLMNARLYRSLPQTVLTLETEPFLAENPVVDLAPYNTGSVHVPNMPARSPSLFTPLEHYSWDTWRQRRGPKAAVRELTVAERADIGSSLLSVERWMHGGPVEIFFERESANT